MSEDNAFCVRGTLDMLATGKIDLEQAENIVNMWIERTARKFYNEGVLDGLRRNKLKVSQDMLDMGM